MSSEFVTIVLNGEPRDLPGRPTLADAVQATGSPAPHQGVAVAVDGDVVPRGEWESRPLAGGERVEVLQAVQGG